MKHCPVGYPSIDHCENPERLKAIIKRITEKHESHKGSNTEIVTSFDEAKMDFVNKGHNLDTYYDYIKNLYDPKTDTSNADTYVNQHSARAALLACNSIKISVDKIFTNKWKNAYAAIRPPGHHAASRDTNEVYGFCFINNVVCGAKYAQEKYKAKKILIFDWDVHHGD